MNKLSNAAQEMKVKMISRQHALDFISKNPFNDDGPKKHPASVEKNATCRMINEYAYKKVLGMVQAANPNLYKRYM